MLRLGTKWRLKKLLMDQLEEVKRKLDEERMVRMRLEAELDTLKNAIGGLMTKDESSASAKKRNAEGFTAKGSAAEAEERHSKRVQLLCTLLKRNCVLTHFHVPFFESSLHTWPIGL